MKWVAWFGAILGVVVALTGIGLTFLIYTPVPFGDQIDFFRRFYEAGGWQNYGLAELYARHNEHRLVVPRLWFLADLRWFDGRQVLTFGGILASAAMHAVLLALLFRGLGSRGWAAVVFLLVALGAMLSPAQWENLTWGFQIQFVQVWLFATLAFAFLAWTPVGERNAEPRIVLILLALLSALASTYSMMNGIVVWPLLLLLAWWRRLPGWSVGTIAAVGAAVIAVEVYGFTVHAGHGDPSETIKQPLDLLRYAARYLTAGVSVIGTLGQEVLGGVLMVYALAMGMWAIVWRNRFRPAHAALLAVAGFVIGAALMTGLGRLPFGLGQANSGRYATPSLVFLLAMGALVFDQIRSLNRRSLTVWASVVGVLLLLVPGLVDGLKPLPDLIDRRDARRHAVTAFLAGGYRPDALKAIYPLWPINAQSMLTNLSRTGEGPFAVIEDFQAPVGLGTYVALPERICAGQIIGVRNDPVDGVVATGWVPTGIGRWPEWVLATDTQDRVIAWGLARTVPVEGHPDGNGRGFEAIGPWGGAAVEAVNLIGVLSKDRYCRIAETVVPETPRFVEQVETILGSASPAPWRIVEGDADAAGTSSVPPPAGAALAIGSFDKSDARFVAEASVVPLPKPAILALPVRTGDYPIDVRVDVVAADDAVIDGYGFGRPSAPGWNWLLLRGPAEGFVGKSDLRLRVTAPGRQQWRAVAVGRPVWIPLDQGR